MARVLYRDDIEFARKKEAEMRRKREEGGYYMELGEGSNPTVIYSEWTCPECLRTLKNTHATCKVTEHNLYACPEQETLDRVTTS